MGYTRQHDETEPGEDAGVASVSYQLARETSRELELHGDFLRAAELNAVALAEEAQRINQQALGALDLQKHPESFRSISVTMAEQQALMFGISAPRLDERAPPLLGRCLTGLAKRPLRRATLPRPRRVLAELARRWHLPSGHVADAWRDFVRDSGGTYTLSPARASATLLAGQAEAVAHATWRFALMDRAASQLMAFGTVPADAAKCATVDEPSGFGACGSDEEDLDSDAPVAATGAGGLSFEEYLIFRCRRPPI